MKPRASSLGVVCSILLFFGLAAHWPADEYKSGIDWPEPALVDPGDSVQPPSDAIVLFDGKSMDAFEGGENWIVENGYAIVHKNGITSKQAFGDCQLHLEFATPAEVSGEGQGRGNSGVYFMGKYELQILDSFENKTYFDGQCAAFYKQRPPLVNASRGPGKWQTYDVVFEAPRFSEDGKLVRPAYATVFHNGVLVHNHFALLGGTFFDRAPAYEKHPDKLPLHIQDHGNPIKFRNIWIRENIQSPADSQSPSPPPTVAEGMAPSPTTGVPLVDGSCGCAMACDSACTTRGGGHLFRLRRSGPASCCQPGSR